MENLIVVAISLNHNSFGLRSVILFGEKGAAIQALSNDLNLPRMGQRVRRDFDQFKSWECVTELPKPPAKVYKAAIAAAQS